MKSIHICSASVVSWWAALRRYFYQGAEGLVKFRVWWWFCQVQVNPATVLSMNICWAGYLQPTEVALVSSECNVSLWKSDNLFRSLICLKIIILAIRPWKGWPKYKAMHIFLLCLTAMQPVKAQVSRAVSGHQLTRYEVVFLCSWPVSPSLTMLYLLNLLKCLLMYFAQCQFSPTV